MKTTNCHHKDLIKSIRRFCMRQYCRVLTALVVVMMVGCSDSDPATDSDIDKETAIKFSEGSTPAPSITEKGGSTQLEFVATKPWSI